MNTLPIEDIAETLRFAKEKKRGCSLLIGAGCSVSAGIPTAAGIVDAFAAKFAHRYADAPQKSYAECMARLAPDVRQDFIGAFMEQARVNWAHLAIAQLLKEGYITRALTTNFDSLLVQACAMVGFFPPVYDLAAAKEFRLSQVPDRAILYLHGQRHGFVILNTKDELREHGARLGPVFEDASRDARVWIVAGYSGENDPVFEHLAAVPTFNYNLYWVGYRDHDPPTHVQERLLSEDRFAHYVRGYDADGFFVELARELRCFPPDLVAKPFTHLRNVRALLTPFNSSGTQDLNAKLQESIDAAIAVFEEGADLPLANATAPAADALDAMRLLFAGDYDRVLELFDGAKNPSRELRDAAAWALVEIGDKLSRRANHAAGAEALALRDAARGRYAAALQIDPGMQRALHSWTVSLIEQAVALPAEAAERDALLTEAEEKCLQREALAPGSGAYVLACVYAIRNDVMNCRRWLSESKKHGRLPSPQHLRSDPDLESVRHLPWFAEFLA